MCGPVASSDYVVIKLKRFFKGMPASGHDAALHGDPHGDCHGQNSTIIFPLPVELMRVLRDSENRAWLDLPAFTRAG